MKFILFIFLLICFVFSCSFRCAVFNPHFTLFYSGKDFVNYFRYKQWRIAPCGALNCYVGLFGKGKTLSCVHTITSLYRKYNNKLVYDKFRHKWVTQQVVILSNVEISVPFIHFENLNQIVHLTHELDSQDYENDTLTYLYVLGDEFSVHLNSRNFKSNINADVLNSILTCRHYHCSIFYTAQRFNHVDALLRQVTQNVISCDKFWRFQRQYVYDAYELENCTNPTMIKPRKRTCWFVRDRDYNAYNTLACVDNLSKEALEGNMLSDIEIIQLRSGTSDETPVNYSKKAKKRIKRGTL